MSAPRVGLPDPRASRAVLVGVSEYTTLEPLPAVANNVTTLRQVVTDPDLWGLPDEHCTTLLNPTSVGEVMDAVHTAASAATDALVFYFAGHGLLDERSELYLALPGSDKERLYRAVRYDDIRREVVGTARACYGKVVILDCCYSGRALQGGMSGPVDVADHARVDGTYLMTASAETSVALAPPGKEYTAFTGALIDKLAHGVPDGPDLLDMETLFYHVRADLQAAHFPVPQQRTRNDGKAIALVRNRRAPRRRTVQELVDTPLRVLPRPPAGFETELRYSPRQLVMQMSELRARENYTSARELLSWSAAQRPDQEVAAIVGLLDEQRRSHDLAHVLMVASWRPPTEVLGIINSLRDIDLPDAAAALLRAVGAGQAEDVAGLARLLRAGERTGDMVELLDAALDTAKERSSLIGLINALWVAGLRDEVDGLIGRAVSRLAEHEIVGLADELREVGREETAFGLYATATAKVAERPPDVVAQLCQAMTAAGHIDECARVADAMIGRVDDFPGFLEVMTAFWDTGQDGLAGRAMKRAATVLPVGGVLVLAAELRAIDRHLAAYQLCELVALSRPGAASHRIITMLRDAGRPVDAKKLLETVAGAAPVPTVAALLGLCTEADRRRVLDVVMQREPLDLAELLAEVELPAVEQQLMHLIEAAITDRVELVPVFVGRFEPEEKERFLTEVIINRDSQEIAQLVRGLLPDDISLLVFLAVREGKPTVDKVLTTIGPGGARRYLVAQPLDRLAPMITGLLRASLVREADMIVDHVAGRDRADDTDHEVAKRIAFLYGNGQPSTGRQVLVSALRGRSPTELEAIIEALRQQGQPEALAAVARWVRSTYGRINTSNGTSMVRKLGLDEHSDRGAHRRR